MDKDEKNSFHLCILTRYTVFHIANDTVLLYLKILTYSYAVFKTNKEFSSHLVFVRPLSQRSKSLQAVFCTFSYETFAVFHQIVYRE